MMQIPDHPDIRDAELNGWGPDEEPVLCPVCHEECDEIYADKDGNPLGCEHCVEMYDAAQWFAWYGEEEP